MNHVQEFLREVNFDDLPDDVVHQARRCLYDLLATAAAGVRTDLADLITGHVEQHFAASATGPAAAPILGGAKVSPVGAALAGGMIIDSVDCHDGHRLTKGHVGCAVLPALLAAFEATGSNPDGREFLALFVAGYEIGTRAGVALHNTVPDYHTSGAWNAVTCAALCAHVLDLGAEAFDHAIGIAEYHGPRSQMMRGIDHPTMLKDGSGWGAMAGVSAAWLAKDGFTGAPAITVTGDNVSEVWGDLGQHWAIRDQYFKLYPVCRWAQPAIAAALSLHADHQFTADQIEQVVISTFHQGVRLYQGHPQNTEQAQYAISFPVAAALTKRKIDPEEIMNAGLQDAGVLAVCDRITVQEEDRFSKVFPAERWAQVTVTLKDGAVLKSEPCEAAGDPHRPLSDEQLRAKYARLTTPVWGEDKSRKVISAIDSLEDIRLFDLLQLIRS